MKYLENLIKFSQKNFHISTKNPPFWFFSLLLYQEIVIQFTQPVVVVSQTQFIISCINCTSLTSFTSTNWSSSSASQPSKPNNQPTIAVSSSLAFLYPVYSNLKKNIENLSMGVSFSGAPLHFLTLHFKHQTLFFIFQIFFNIFFFNFLFHYFKILFIFL